MFTPPKTVLKIREKYGERFKKIFDGLEINYFLGPLVLLGIPDFDIIEFGRYMKTMGYNSEVDGSLRDYVQKYYGNEGVDLIKELINMDPLCF